MTWKYLYAVIGIPIILVLGGIGVLVPPFVAHFLPSFSLTKQYYFTFFNGLAAGLILSVAFVHSLPDGAEGFDNIVSILYDPEEAESSSESISYAVEIVNNTISVILSPSLINASYSSSEEPSEPDGPATYPWFGFIAMMGALFTFLSEEIVVSISDAFHIWNPHGHGSSGHSHGGATRLESSTGEEGCQEVVAPNKSDSSLELSSPDMHSHSSDADKAKELNEGYLRPITKMMILFVGLILHNVFVGIALGLSDSLELFIAILFHQFFEGLGMGSRVALAKLSRILVILLIDTIFALACPIGIVVGILIRLRTDPESKAFYACDGLFQSLSGGILIYISVMHLLKSYMESEAKGRVLQIHKWVSFAGVLVGAAIMAVIGIWA